MGDGNDTNKSTGFMYKNKFFDKYTTPEILDEVCRFRFLPTDIVLATYSRSGTTFAQEIIWQIKNRTTTSKDEKADMTMVRFPFLEFDISTFPAMTKTGMEILESQANDPYRLIKTHVPYEFIRESMEKTNAKLIIVIRNPKDCLVSNYHFERNFPFGAFEGTLQEFIDLFVEGRVSCGNYFHNNREWWALRKKPNVLLLFYEDLVTHLPKNVKIIAKFMGDDLTDCEVEKIVHNSSFSTMAKNPNINIKFTDKFTFLRKGIAGDWKEYLSEEQNKALDEIIEREFKGCDLEFIYE